MACVIFGISLLGACATQSDVALCGGSQVNGAFKSAADPETAQLMRELLDAVAAAGAMRPTLRPPYRHYVLASGEQAVLCELGPCLPSSWLFERSNQMWVLQNRPEGICVAASARPREGSRD